MRFPSPFSLVSMPVPFTTCTLTPLNSTVFSAELVSLP